MAGDQRRLAYASKRDSTSMKTISLLGSIFLPATLLASIFSMTFFNFQNGKSKDSSIPRPIPRKGGEKTTPAPHPGYNHTKMQDETPSF